MNTPLPFNMHQSATVPLLVLMAIQTGTVPHDIMSAEGWFPTLEGAFLTTFQRFPPLQEIGCFTLGNAATMIQHGHAH